MSLEKINNYVESSQNRLIQMYREEKTNNDLIKNLVDPIQELEDELFKFYGLKSISNGVGYQLDVIGKILDVERQGRTDNDYRTILYIQTLINNSGGEPESIINIIKLLIAPDKISYTEIYPANYQLHMQTDKFVNNLRDFIQSISPAGVGQVILTQSTSDNPLQLEDIKYDFYDYAVDNNGTLLEVDTDTTLQVVSEFISSNQAGNFLGEVFLNEAIYSVGDDGDGVNIEYAVDDDKEILLELDLNDANEDYTIADFGAKLGEDIR